MQRKNYEIYEIEDAASGRTVESYLKEVLQYSSRKRQKLTRAKGIRINGKPAFLKRLLKSGDQLKLMTLEDNTYGATPEPGPIQVLYEDDDTIVLNKPPFQLVHPTGQTNKQTLANFLAFYFQQKNLTCIIRPLHRLDRNTSGCILFAKNAAAQTKLEKQREAGTLKRGYLALACSLLQPQNSAIDAPIARHAEKPNQRIVSACGKPAVTHYQTLQATESHSLLELHLATGRTHQIRVHLAHRHAPVLGDAMYGKRSSLIRRQALHAAKLTFLHLKTGKPVMIAAPLAEDMRFAAEQLGLHDPKTI